MRELYNHLASMDMIEFMIYLFLIIGMANAACAAFIFWRVRRLERRNSKGTK